MGQVMVNIHMIKIFAVFVHLSLLLLILDLNGRFNLKKKKKIFKLKAQRIWESENIPHLSSIFHPFEI